MSFQKFTRARIIAIAALGVISAAASAADGKAVYNVNCGMCHNAMSPKLGDKEAWAARIKLGNAALVSAVIKGKGSMPPRGGKKSLSDAEIQAAVGYLVSQSQ